LEQGGAVQSPLVANDDDLFVPFRASLRRRHTMKRFALLMIGMLALGLGGSAFGAAGIQSRPGGIVADRGSGYYDPLRSTYVVTATSTAAQSKPGGNVVDRSGGYYDPARSIYVPASHRVASDAVAAPSTSFGPHGFSWADASMGGAVGAGTIVALLGAAALAVRRRRPAM